MNYKIVKVFISAMLISVSLHMFSYAGAEVPGWANMFNPSAMTLTNDGDASWSLPYSITGVTWKKYAIELRKRYTVSTTAAGTPVYAYKSHGSKKYVEAGETSYNFSFSQTGYYAFHIRVEDLDGNYSPWVEMYDASPYGGDPSTYVGLAVTEDDISVGGGGSIDSDSGSGFGPGTAQTSIYPQSQYAVIGPNGEVLYYYYPGNTTNGIYPNQGAYMYSGNNAILGPGFANNNAGGTQVITPYTGVSNYTQVPAPNIGGSSIASGNNYSSNITGQGTSATTNPNLYNGGTATPGVGGSISVSPQITQGLEIGWHVDTNGRFYYQGNGALLKGTWYLIDGAFYRFGDTGYVLTNQWFKDPASNNWYYLAGDGRMLTGWQCLNGVWYYFRPENGNGYGTMYANTALTINDAVYGSGVYAFDSNGAMVKNAWFGGYYYGNDGKRTN